MKVSVIFVTVIVVAGVCHNDISFSMRNEIKTDFIYIL